MSNVITAINAKPEEIKLFMDNYEYIIPDYQRPYSWGRDECEQLWEDLMLYYEENSQHPYFLGNVVVYNSNNKRYIVDGQQRLITLNIFVKALLDKCGTFHTLGRMIYKYKSLDGGIIEPREPRVKSEVLGDNENNSLRNVLLCENNLHININNTRYKENHKVFTDKLENFLSPMSSTDIENFVQTIIEKVVLLPIECTDFDSALTIFETINNRGMDLTDTDIFKSKLYRFAEDDKEIFTKRWNALISELDKLDNITMKDLFTIYMHVLRGKERNIDNIIKLRKFFDTNASNRLSDWNDVMTSLEKLMLGWKYINDRSYRANVDILNFVKVLKLYPNMHWQYPVMTFLHNNIKLNHDDEFEVQNTDILETIVKETTRYCYWKWLRFRSLSHIKDTIFKAVRAIYHNEDYVEIYQKDMLKEINNERFNEETHVKNILNNILQKDLGRGLKGVCLLSALLNDKQNSLIPDNWQLEHILPKNWGNYKYDSWDDSTFNKYHNKLGNLVPIEKNLNPKASNKFFIDKKTFYMQSSIKEVIEISEIKGNWTPKEFYKRSDKIKDKLANFFMRS